MAWKGRTKKPVDFSNLLTTLLRTNLNQTNIALYQFLEQLVNKTQQSDQQTNQILQTFIGDIIINDDTDLSAILALLEQLNNITQLATFWTENDETSSLPSSRRVIAGTGIILDYSVAGQVTVSAAGGGVCYIPLATGTEPLTFMSDGNGQPFLIPFTL